MTEPGEQLTRRATLASAPKKSGAAKVAATATNDQASMRRATTSVVPSSSASGEKLLARKPSKGVNAASSTLNGSSSRASSKLNSRRSVRVVDGDEKLSREEREKRRSEKRKSLKAEAVAEESPGDNGKKGKKKLEKKKTKEDEEAIRLAQATEKMSSLTTTPVHAAAALASIQGTVLKKPGALLEQYQVVEGDQEIAIEEASVAEINTEPFERKKRPPLERLETDLESEEPLPPVNTSDVDILKKQLQIKEREFLTVSNRAGAYARNLQLILARFESK